MFSQIEKSFLLSLARKSISYYFENSDKLIIQELELPTEKLKEKRGTFVTLTKEGDLRGCIGCLEPVRPIYLDIIENAVSAGFFDYRFIPLTKEEFEKIKIEISILTLPEKINYKSIFELLNFIEPLKHGVIIKKVSKSATYLPQVWEDFANKEDFLYSLCLKAGLKDNEWENGDLEVFVYEAEVFGE